MEIIETFKAQHRSLEITVLKQPITVHDTQIKLTLSSELQVEIFGKAKQEVQESLRKKLKNYQIVLEHELNEEIQENSQKLYTNTDKLRYLLKKNGALAELQRRFGLEADF